MIPALELIQRPQRHEPEQRPREVFDTISDNAANAGEVILGGRPIKQTRLDLRWITALLYRNGVIEETGVATGVLNHPANGVAWLANGTAPTMSSGRADHLLGGSFTRASAGAQGRHLPCRLHGNMGAISCRFVWKKR